MKIAIALLVSIVVALFVWSLSRLSSDAIGMALGLGLGVFSFIPTLWLVNLARRRDDDWQPTIIDYPPPVFADQVTPYSHLFRRAAGMTQLPDRRAEIDMLRAAADYLENEARR